VIVQLTVGFASPPLRRARLLLLLLNQYEAVQENLS